MSKKLLDKKTSKTDEEMLLKEISELFSACNDDVKQQMELQVFQSKKGDYILYILNDKYFFGKHFSKDYSLSVLKGVLPMCEKNGIKVVEENESSYVLTFSVF